MTHSTRIDTLDGLRAIAVLLVIVHHTFALQAWNDVFYPWAPGPAGVRVFFVLSGFLITGILIRARDKAALVGASRRHVWLAFYARRTLRIFPLAWFALACAWLVGIGAMTEAPAWYLGFAANIYHATTHAWTGGIPHFWSLAVEEQFYLAWPFLILWCPRRWLPVMIGGLIASAVLSRAWLLYHGDVISAYALTTSRLDSLALGGWLAIIGQSRRVSSVSLAVAGAIFVVVGYVSPLAFDLCAEFGLVLASAAVVLAVSRLSSTNPIGRILTVRPMVYLGTISYGIYVWHHVLPAAVEAIERQHNVWLRFPVAFGWSRFVVVLIGSIVMAVLSWEMFERRLNALKDRFSYVNRTATTPRSVVTPIRVVRQPKA